jgi:hypothetical protein
LTGTLNGTTINAGTALQTNATTRIDNAGVLTNVDFGGTTNTGTLRVANGGTGQTSLGTDKILVGNGTSAIVTPTNLHWDSTNNRLGIITSTPTQTLDVNGTIKANTINTNSFYSPGCVVQVAFRATIVQTFLDTSYTASDIYVTITPKFATSRLLVIANVNFQLEYGYGNSEAYLQIRRDDVEDTNTVGNRNSLVKLYDSNPTDGGGHQGKTSISSWYLANNTNSTTFKVYGQRLGNWSRIGGSSFSVGLTGGTGDMGRSEIFVYEIAQ